MRKPIFLQVLDFIRHRLVVPGIIEKPGPQAEVLCIVYPLALPQDSVDTYNEKFKLLQRIHSIRPNRDIRFDVSTREKLTYLTIPQAVYRDFYTKINCPLYIRNVFGFSNSADLHTHFTEIWHARRQS